MTSRGPIFAVHPEIIRSISISSTFRPGKFSYSGFKVQAGFPIALRIACQSESFLTAMATHWSKPDRTVVKQEVNLWSPEGKLMAKGLHHQSFLLGHSGDGTVKLRDPKKKEGVRKFEVPDGEAIGPVESDISLEMCGVFFHGNRSYHTSKEAAAELGFDEVVVGGRMTMSYIGDMMDRRFGKGWYEGGHLDIKFTNIVWPDDHVITKGVITDHVKENGGTRANVAVWVEKTDGTVAIVGTASALE